MQLDRFKFWTKAEYKRSIVGFISSEESVSYCYEPSIIDRYVELDYGLITVNHTASINNGSITEKNRTLEDYVEFIMSLMLSPSDLLQEQ